MLAAVSSGEDVGHGLSITEDLLLQVRPDPPAPGALDRRPAALRQELVDRPKTDCHVDAIRLWDPPLLGHFRQLVQGSANVLFGQVGRAVDRLLVGFEELGVLFTVDRFDAVPLHVLLAIIDATLGHHTDAAIPRLDDDHLDVREVVLDLRGKLDADEARADDDDAPFAPVEVDQDAVLLLQVVASAGQEPFVEAAPSAALDVFVEEGRVPEAF
mmetsp:Transcript_98006/g.245509  ORF Transcript_98006/g.245509 Transcript_98006/m.245509 type:complete len:214 (-) Transcript_98006:568-1209(-)